MQNSDHDFKQLTFLVWTPELSVFPKLSGAVWCHYHDVTDQFVQAEGLTSDSDH